MSWSIENNKLTRQFSFENQTKAIEFLLKIAKKSDEVGHHPDVSIFKCSQVRIELFTHDKNEITELDYALARFIDSVFL